MKILAVIPGEESNPNVMIFARKQVEALNETGLTVESHFLTSRSPSLATVRSFHQLQAKAQSFRPDIVHAHYGTMTGFLCSLLKPARLVITFRGNDLNPDPALKLWRRHLGFQLSRIAERRAAHTILVSRGLERYLQYPEKSTVIPSGLDFERVKPINKAEARQRLGLPDSKRLVLFYNGGNAPVKRPELARNVVSKTQAQLVTLNGTTPHEEVPLFLSACDALILTSVNEGSPNIVKEAVLCGLPVVSTPVGDVAETVQNDKVSIVCPDHETPSLVSALTQVLSEASRGTGRESLRHLERLENARRIADIYHAIAKPEVASPPKGDWP